MSDKRILIGFKTHPYLKALAEAEAERQNRTLSNLCENALEFYLEHESTRSQNNVLGGLKEERRGA